MAREVINIIERTNIVFLFREITLDSSMLAHSVCRVFVLKMRLTREEKETKILVLELLTYWRIGSLLYPMHSQISCYINMIKFRCLSS
jgi:hypothetical protein